MRNIHIWIKIRNKLIYGITTIILTFGIFGITTFALADCIDFTNNSDCAENTTCTWNIESSVCEDIMVDLTLDKPSKIQTVEVDTTINLEEGWKPSALQTFGSKFLVRGKEALSWSLNINSIGLETEAIQNSYNRVLTIVNSLFILGLLAIAAMWMFSIIIPRHYLKQVILIYAAAVIFVNFAMPLNKLFIDGTNLLQQTLLTSDSGSIAITDIVQTPEYGNIIGYTNSENNLEISNEKIIKIPNENEEDVRIPLGTIDSPAYNISGTSGENTVSLTVPNLEDNIITLNTNSPITVSETSNFQTNSEQIIFSFLLVLATGFAYLILALIFVLRIIILWALLIFSPILFLLAIFRLTRGWFWNWLSIYGKWLLIGPLTALGISIIINIWQLTGIPITSTYESGTFTRTSNILFYLPGSTEPNTLSTTSEMMEYLIFLMMLYLPIFCAFILTRHKILNTAAINIVNKVINRNENRNGNGNNIKTSKGEDNHPRKKTGLTDNITNFVSSKVEQFTQSAIPKNISAISGTSKIQTSSNFLPEKLAITDIHSLLELIGAKKESRGSREQAIKKLVNPSLITNQTERSQVASVRNEIEKRANKGDSESTIIMNEIHSKIETNASTNIGAPIKIPTPLSGENRSSVVEKNQVTTTVTTETPKSKSTTPLLSGMEHVVEEKEKEAIIIEKDRTTENRKENTIKEENEKQPLENESTNDNQESESEENPLPKENEDEDNIETNYSTSQENKDEPNKENITQ